VSALRASESLTRLASYSTELFPRLEAETGVHTGFKAVGSIWTALDLCRMEELRRLSGLARAFDVECQELSPQEIGDKYPVGLNVSDMIGGMWLPGDGVADPVNVTMALAKGARMGGAIVMENTTVQDIIVEEGVAKAVVTDKGRIEADTIINCGGMWGRELGAMAGAAVPLHACEHFYIVTEPFETPLPRDLPVLRVSASIYLQSTLHLPRFTSIYPDLPRFTPIYLDLPRFTSIYLDLPRFTPISGARRARLLQRRRRETVAGCLRTPSQSMGNGGNSGGLLL